MTNEERYKKYIREYCSNCKNKTRYDCEIKIYKNGNIVITKCDYYERKDYNNCMKRKCQECKFYNRCFGYIKKD